MLRRMGLTVCLLIGCAWCFVAVVRAARLGESPPASPTSVTLLASDESSGSSIR